MTDTTTPQPVLATIALHGTPRRALWHGAGSDGPPAPEGIPCTITAVGSGRWRVQCDGSKPWIVGPRTRVWLTLLPEAEQPEPGPAMYMPDPWSVVLRLERPTLGAYRQLSHALALMANAANDGAAMAVTTDPQAAADLRTIRDTFRKAATDALIGRLSNNPTPCRRCGAACTNCTPPPVPA